MKHTEWTTADGSEITLTNYSRGSITLVVNDNYDDETSETEMTLEDVEKLMGHLLRHRKELTTPV